MIHFKVKDNLLLTAIWVFGMERRCCVGENKDGICPP